MILPGLKPEVLVPPLRQVPNVLGRHRRINLLKGGEELSRGNSYRRLDLLWSRLGHAVEGNVPRQPRTREWALARNSHQRRGQGGRDTFLQGTLQEEVSMTRTLLPNEILGNGTNSRASTNAGTSGGHGVGRPTCGREKITAPYGHDMGVHVVGRG